MDKQKFIEWLEAHKWDVVGHRTYIWDCPLARWQKSVHPEASRVTFGRHEGHIFDKDENQTKIDMQQWAKDFVEAVDHQSLFKNKPSAIKGFEALEILDCLQR